jgi:hypothetical protein
VADRIEEISYLLSKHKYDMIGEVNYTHHKITRELEQDRVHSRRKEEYTVEVINKCNIP